MQLLVADVLGLGLLHQPLVAPILQQLQQLVVLGRPAAGLQQLDPGLLLAPLGQQLLGLGRQAVDQQRLGVHQPGHRPHHLVVAVGGVLHRTGDDQRGPGLVDQHRVHLVHDGEAVLPLDALGDVAGHVVPQVVEAELVVGPVDDIAPVHLPPLRGAGLGFVQTAHRQSQEAEDLAHPLAVAPGQVVVDRHQVDAAAGQGVEVEGEDRHQGLALAGGHLRYPALVQHDAAQQLDVEGHHVPRLLDAHHLPAPAQVPAAGFLDHGIGLGQQVVQDLPVLASRLPFAGDVLPEPAGPGRQLFVGQGLEIPGQPVDLLDQRPQLPGLTLVLAAEQGGKYASYHNILII